MEDKISVIVPVYGVEPYLRKCLDSLVGQSYRNLEIILVDDGSPDRCGEICGEYAGKDSRIQVIHKENGGVSSARNAGLRAASGDWIGWVDSDDWVERDMFEYLLGNAKQHQADIAVCGRCEHYKNHQRFRGWEGEQLLGTEDALKCLLENDIMQNYLWDKLWKRELFRGIVFPEGKTFEDIAVMHRLFERASRVVCLPEWKYNYYQRAGSIVDDSSLQNRINHFMAARNRLEEMREDWPQYLDLLEAQCVASSIMVWCSYCANPKPERERAWVQIEEMSAFARAHRSAGKKRTNLGLAGRLVARLVPYPAGWAFRTASLIGRLYKLRHGRTL